MKDRKKAKEMMTPHPAFIAPDATLQDAARKMKEVDCGILPVGSEDKIEGMITDRDIVIRAVCEGKNPATEKVRDYMTDEVCACDEDATLDQAAEEMRRNDVSRLIVKDRSGKACGILTFGAILRKDDNIREVAEVVACATGRRAA